MRLFIAVAALAVMAFGQPVIAEEATSRDAVRIETDQRAKAFVFIIDDNPVAMLDKAGLHVVGGIDYGLSLTDTGPDSIKETIAKRRQEADDE